MRLEIIGPHHIKLNHKLVGESRIFLKERKMLGRFRFRAHTLLFRIVPFLVVSMWLCVFMNRRPTKSESEDDGSGRTVRNRDRLIVRARNKTSKGDVFFEKEFNLSETVVYVDMWRSHWCTYYNDREYFFTPRINEMTQHLRSIGLPTVHISMGADAYTGGTDERKAGKEIVARGALPVLEKYNAQAMRFHKDYIPGFVDTCVYTDQERFGRFRDNHLTKRIAVAKNDYIVQNFKESAEAFVGLGAKTVIVLGQHTNMCLMAVFLYCQQVGLDLVIVRDLVDSCWLYDYQKKHSKSHTEGNTAVNDYFDDKFGSSISSYDLLTALKQMDVPKHNAVYSMFSNTAHIFSAI